MPPIIGVISGIGGSILGKMLLRTAVAVGGGFLLNALAPKPEDGGADKIPGGVSLKIKAGTEVPRTVPLGKVADSGHFVYWNLYGSKNKFLQLVYVLGDAWCDSLVYVYVDGKKKNLIATTSEGGAAATYRIEDFGSLITVRFFDGRDGQLADTMLVNNAQPSGRWDSAYKFTGMAYVSLTMEWDQDKFQGGIPEFNWVFRGAKLYDWRKDSSNGGSGTQRWNTKSTWAWTDNPAVMRWNYMRGFFIGTERIAGMGLPEASLIKSLFTSAANVCDEMVDTVNGNMQERYRCNLIITDDQKHDDNVRLMDQSMAAGTIQRAGLFAPLVGASQTSAASITDDDFVADEPLEYTAKRSRADLFNAVFGRFLNDKQHWEMDSYDPQIDSAAVTADGSRIVRDSTDFPQVISHFQAQRLARIALAQNRFQATGRGSWGFHLINVQLGDWIVWDSAAYGFTKTFQVVSRSIKNDPRMIQVELQEVGASIYTSQVWVDSEDEGSTQTVTLSSTVTSFLPVATTLSKNNKQLPAINLTYSPEVDPTVKGILFEYRIVGSAAATRVQDFAPTSGSFIATEGVLPAVPYEARATIVTLPVRTTVWTNWIPVTTDDARINYEQLATALQTELNKLSGNAAGSLNDSIARIAALESEIDTKNHVFVQNDAPVSTPSLQIQDGDLWFDSNDNNAQYVRSEGVWTPLPVGGGGGAQTYFQNDAPTSGMLVGDLWIEADNKNALYRYSGSAWVIVRDTSISDAANAVITETNNRITADQASYNSLNAVNSRFAVKGNTFYQATAPVIGPAITVYVGNPPVATASNEPLRAGDLWFDSANQNRMNRYSGTSWIPVPDGNKNKIFYQTTAPASNTPGLAIGDLWIDSDGSSSVVGQPPNPANTPYRWDGAAWTLVRDTLVNTTWSDVNTEATTRAGRDNALGAIMNTVWAEVDKINAGGFMRLISSSGTRPADVTARFEVYLRVDAPVAPAAYTTPQFGADGAVTRNFNIGTPVYASAGFYLDIVPKAGGGYSARAMFDVDQFAIGKGGTKVAPFSVSGGVVYIQNLKVALLENLSANMGTITAGRLLGNSGLVDFNLGAGTLLFYG